MKTENRIVLSIAASLLAGFLSGCGNGGPQVSPDGIEEPHSLTFAMDWLAVPAQAGFYQALGSGGYREAGLDITIEEATSSSQYPTSRVAAGQIELCVAESTRLLQAVAKGIPLVAIFCHNSSMPTCLVVHKDGPIRSFADLDGKRLLVTPGVPWIDYLKQRYEIDFRVSARPPSLAQFMRDTSLEAVQQVYATNQLQILEEAGVPHRPLMLTDAGYDPMRLVVARKEWADANPEIIEAFARASMQGYHDYFFKDPRPGNAELQTRNPLLSDQRIEYHNKRVMEGPWIFPDAASGVPFGWVPPERLAQDRDLLIEIGLLEPDSLPPIEELIYSPELLKGFAWDGQPR
ncbi:MAG: ABC transporter substrate-binding protein [Verrucomicrobiota bacterium]